MSKGFRNFCPTASLTLAVSLGMPHAIAQQPGMPKGTGPDIGVNPTALTISLAPGQSATTTTFRINNTGGASLNWTAPGATVATTVLNQVTDIGAGISTYYVGLSTGAYRAVDFTVPAGNTRLRSIQVYGDDPTRTLAAQPSITWWIFPDASGVPAGNPETHPAAAVWRHTALIGRPGMTITNEDPRLDLVAAGQQLVLAPGTYWVSVVPNYVNTPPDNRQNAWYWQASTNSMVGSPTAFFAPILFGGTSGWEATPVNARNELAISIAGEVPCSAPWLQVLTSSGSVAVGGNVTVSVSINAAGIGSGPHLSNICIQSNDADTPVLRIPVRLVGGTSMFRNGFESTQ